MGVSSRQEAATISEPQIIGLRGPNLCSSFSPTRMKAMIVTAYPSVSRPAPQAEIASGLPAGRARCSICWLTMSRPMVAFRMKLEIVAPVKVVLENRAKSTKGAACLRSQSTNRAIPAKATMPSTRVTRLAQPSCLPKISTIIRASAEIMKMIRPMKSKPVRGPPSTLLSGVPRIIRIEITVITIDAMKM